MPGEPFIFIAVLLLGLAAFFFSAIYVVVRVVGAVFSSLGRLLGGSGVRRPIDREAPVGIACPREGCRNVEYRHARFCSQCGARLL